jgi:hypothetical protein
MRNCWCKWHRQLCIAGNKNTGNDLLLVPFTPANYQSCETLCGFSQKSERPQISCQTPFKGTMSQDLWVKVLFIAYFWFLNGVHYTSDKVVSLIIGPVHHLVTGANFLSNSVLFWLVPLKQNKTFKILKRWHVRIFFAVYWKTNAKQLATQPF